MSDVDTYGMELTAEELQAIEVALDGFYPVSHSALVLKFRQMNYDISPMDGRLTDE